MKQSYRQTAALLVLLFGLLAGARTGIVHSSECERWVSPTPAGNNELSGSSDAPWATLAYAVTTVPDDNCTVWITAGTYSELSEIDRRFETMTTFKAVEPYTAVFESDRTIIKLNGARNLLFEGFELRHLGQALDKHLIIADRRNELWSENITFRNNIFHDSTNQDLLKLHNGVRFITVEGNVFYNQGPAEQHLDINGATDIIVQDNIFFNDFAGSDREDPGDTKHFIAVKDSNEDDDGVLGSHRILIRRNIFLNWQGNVDTMIQIGNDGKPYHEVKDVLIENNLMLGNSPSRVDAAFGVRGAKNVHFNHNTVVGDLPAKAYAFRVSITDENLPNENIEFHNNIWSDPTGTMGSENSGLPKFANGMPEQTLNLVLDNNLYWNGDAPIPQGDLLDPAQDDANGIFGNPGLEPNQTAIVLPRWEGKIFLSGNKTIGAEFERLVQQYGSFSCISIAVDHADSAHSALEDILQKPRGESADIGAFESDAPCWKTFTPMVAFQPQS